jgi:YaiO family outer membrane protein
MIERADWRSGRHSCISSITHTTAVAIVFAIMVASTCYAATSSAAEASFTEIELGTNRETLSSDAPDWTSSFVSLSHQFTPRQNIILRAAQYSRFGARDDAFTLSAYLPAGDKTTFFLEGSASRDHRYLARDGLQAQLLQGFTDGWGGVLGVRHQRYDTSDVTIGEVTIEKYFADYRAAFTYSPSHSSTAGNAASFRAVIAYYYGDRSNVQLSVGRGEELERANLTLPIVVTDVRAATIYGRHAISSAWAINYAIGRTTRANVTHHEFSVGASFRFK